MLPSPRKPKVTELASFEALRELVADSKSEDPHCLARHSAAEVFYTVPWFENLAMYGFSASGGRVSPLLLVASEVVPDATDRCAPTVCLPFAADAHLSGLSNYYSSLYGPLVWQTPGAATWLALAQHLRHHPSRWPVVTLSPLDQDSTFYTGIELALKQAGYWVDTYFCFGNWYLNVAQRNFDQYMSSVPSALRNGIARGRRRLTKQGHWNIHIQQAPNDALESTIASFVHVYNQSWKPPEPHADFIPNLVRMAASRGWLRLGLLTLNGQTIAAQLWLVKDRKASIFKLAFVEGFEKLSAGSVLTHALMRHVIDTDQVHEVDYLTGDDPYKRDWMSHRRERRGILAFHPGTLEGLVRAALHWAGKWLRRRPKLPN